METEYRIVVVDEHIIAQFNQVGWWTCSKANNNDEGDFAVWPYSESNLQKAFKLIGTECRPIEPPIDCYTEQHTDGKWYIHRSGEVDLREAYNGKNEALRNLARAL